MRLKPRPELMQWSRVFAWFPVEVADNDTRWLEFVERRIVERGSTWAGDWETVEYRAP